MKICVNAGHFVGVDSGAVGQNGTQEACVNKIIAIQVVEKLKSKGHNVILVTDKSLSNVVKASNDFGADYFISIHCNSATNKQARGTETFYWKGCPKGKKLAKAINDEIVGTLGTRDRGIKENTTYYVVKYTKAPAALVECEFISNLEGEKLLIEKMSVFAEAITNGILKGIK